MNDSDCTNVAHTVKERLFTDICNICGMLPTYADDSTIVITTKTRFAAQVRIVRKVEEIKTFLDTNSLAINLTKTEIVEIMVHQKRTRMSGNSHQLSVTKSDGILKIISAADSCRLLGVNITWSHHLELGDKPLLSSLRSTLGALTFIAHNLPLKSHLLLANGLLISKIVYLIPMWGGLPAKDARQIQTIMNKCARMILGRSRRTRSRILMTNCKWLYFVELVKFHSLLAMWKLHHLNTPYHLRSKFSTDQDHNMNTTGGRIKTSRKSFRWRTSTDWNNLPSTLREEDKLRTFKNQSKEIHHQQQTTSST